MEGQCPLPEGGVESDGEGNEDAEFNWNSQLQGLILGGFAFGYVSTQLVGALLAEKFGAKWIYGCCIGTCAALNMLAPAAAKTNPSLLIALRVVQGALQGPSFPVIYSMARKWIPTSEKTRLMILIQVGTGT